MFQTVLFPGAQRTGLSGINDRGDVTGSPIFLRVLLPGNQVLFRASSDLGCRELLSSGAVARF